MYDDRPTSGTDEGDLEMKRLAFDFEVKKKGKNVTIEGYANANTVDRMKERIDPKGWVLDNYKKNPVVLFDHGHDPAFGFMPIGKTIAIAPDENGLYVKIQLSNSQTEKITAVRDLVEEGILKTFSVGFDPQEDTKDGDTILITKAELIENSIVPIPMNQDSTFSVLAKRLGNGVSPLAKRWFDSFTKKTKLVKEKKFLAAILVQRIADLQEKGDFDLKKVINYVASAGGINPKLVEDIIAGKVIGPSPKVLKAFAESLKIDSKLLASVGLDGVSVLVKAREEVKMDMEEDKKEEEKSAVKMGTLVIHQIHIPKAMFDEAEGAAGTVEENGYKADKMSETELYWVFDQVDAAEVDAENGYMIDLGQGIMAHVAPPKGAAAADPEPENEDEELTDEDAEKAAAPCEDEEDPKKKTAIPTGDAAIPQDQNPYLELARTTNTMLGSLIEITKAMSAKLDGLVQEPPKKEEEEEDDAMKGILSQIRIAHSTTGDRLKRLGL
jgi:HK97 family phage prohead protease